MQQKIKKAVFDFHEVLNKVFETLKPMADKKAIELIIDASPGMIKINSNRHRIEQILIILISSGKLRLSIFSTGS